MKGGTINKDLYPASTRHQAIVGSMLVHHLQLWTKFEQTMGQCPVFAGYTVLWNHTAACYKYYEVYSSASLSHSAGWTLELHLVPLNLEGATLPLYKVAV